MQAIEQKILSRIYGRGRGWSFTKTDFVADFGEANIHKALSALTQAGTIRRVCVGVYDYPRQSELLGQLSPDVDQVAQALARKFNWRIQPSGDTALNLLGLSTQVPGSGCLFDHGLDLPRACREVNCAGAGASRRNGLKRTEGLVVQAQC